MEGAFNIPMLLLVCLRLSYNTILRKDIIMKRFGKICLYLKMIKPHRIKNAFMIFKKEGLSGIKYHFYLVKDKEKGLQKKCKKEYDILPVREEQELERYDIIEFEEKENPLVSIIIPVFNQFAYTYNCLKSIQKNSIGINYEVIVGDDNSTDLTKMIEKIVKGIKVVHNEKNYQFLVNCNKISKLARGKYIVFLNNDTQVQRNWLETLVALMEREPQIGLAGSKLVYPNGLVQEAGGIVWKDATVLQYGNNRQPGEEELIVLREVDYISGASIIIRKELWEDIGGFDERFAPAYYEDVDLAFRVRESGYKVMYQPGSEVVHFESVTQSVSKNKKQGIEENRRKIIEKWSKVLESKHYAAKEYAKAANKMKTKQNT